VRHLAFDEHEKAGKANPRPNAVLTVFIITAVYFMYTSSSYYSRTNSTMRRNCRVLKIKFWSNLRNLKGFLPGDLSRNSLTKIEKKYCAGFFITGPPNGPVLFCWLASVVVCRLSSSSVTLTAIGRAGRQSPAAGRVKFGRPTLHGGPVRLRRVRARPCLLCDTVTPWHWNVSSR